MKSRHASVGLTVGTSRALKPGVGLIVAVLFGGLAASVPAVSAQESEELVPLGTLPGCKWVHDEGMNTFRLLDLQEEGPGDLAGLEIGDVLVALNGEKTNVASVVSAITYFDSLVVGEEVELTVRRGGEEVVVTMLVEAMPADFQRRLEQQRSTFLGQARRQDAMNWLKRSTGGGPVVIHVARLLNGDLRVTATGAHTQPPESMTDWMLKAQVGDDLQQLRPGEWVDYEASMGADGNIAIDRVSD